MTKASPQEPLTPMSRALAPIVTEAQEDSQFPGDSCHDTESPSNGLTPPSSSDTEDGLLVTLPRARKPEWDISTGMSLFEYYANPRPKAPSCTAEKPEMADNAPARSSAPVTSHGQSLPGNKPTLSDETAGIYAPPMCRSQGLAFSSPGKEDRSLLSQEATPRYVY